MLHPIVDPSAIENLEDWGPKPEPLSGAPRESGLIVAGDEEGPLEVGVWECTPGAWRITKDCDEFCHLLQGHWRLTADGGDVTDLHAGDSVFLPGGFSGTAEVLSTVRKVYCMSRSSILGAPAAAGDEGAEPAQKGDAK